MCCLMCDLYLHAIPNANYTILKMYLKKKSSALNEMIIMLLLERFCKPEKFLPSFYKNKKIHKTLSSLYCIEFSRFPTQTLCHDMKRNFLQDSLFWFN